MPDARSAFGGASALTYTPPARSGAATTRARLTYVNQGRLTDWQNAPTSPNATAGFLYDGEGQRVAQQTTQGGITTTTIYVGNIEEVATTGV